MERIIKQWKDAKLCDGCQHQEIPERTLATHSVTDSRQQANDTWQETPPRHGCANHPVVAMVILLDGREIPFVEYVNESGAHV